MAHKEQQDFCKRVKELYPESFKNKKVLDIGSLDINGNNRFLFNDCDITGLDLAEGKNVDVICLAHEYDAPDETFDTIISTEVFEHDMFYPQTLKNIMRMLKSGGLFLFTCATDERAEHGTLRSDGGFSSPLTIQYEGWENYYKNLSKEDVLNEIPATLFSSYKFEYNAAEIKRDIYFYGIKK